MSVWVERVRVVLEGRGFRTSVKRVRYATLTGGLVVEERLVAVKPGARLSVSRVGGELRVSLAAEGEWGAEEAEGLEGLGGSVEVGEGRLLALFKHVPESGLERLVSEVLDYIGA
ncbi:hypothetical protein [Stetteria hydrogenophila]